MDPAKKFSEVLRTAAASIAVYLNTSELRLSHRHRSSAAVSTTDRFNIDMMHDSNGLFRAFAVAGMHPAPKPSS